MSNPDKILAMARLGPLLPTKVASEIGTNSIMAGAIMSELCAKGRLKVSNLKVGGSPLYLIPGNESQLLQFTKHLNEKDQKTVELLGKEKVIRESEVDPLTRVSLSQIKDFAKPLIVEYGDVQERFWKWFDLPDSEAEIFIRKILQPEPVKKDEIVVEKKESIEKVQKTEAEKEIKKEPPEVLKKDITKKKKPKADVWDAALAFFKSNEINVVEKAIVKKNTDLDLVVEVPSVVGRLQYYCKVRAKKRVSDSDLSSAYVQGQFRKLPVIFLTTGELTKKAKEVLSKLKGLTFKRL